MSDYLKYIDVNGIQTRYFEKGTGEAVVLIHGGNPGTFYNSLVWDLNFDYLSQYFHVIAFDRLAMGRTGIPDSRKIDYPSIVEHSVNFLEALGLRDVTLVGHSRGGFVATLICLQRADLMSKLILVDSGTTAPDIPPRTSDFYAELDSMAPTVETRESVLRELKANSYDISHLSEELKNETFELANLATTKEAKLRFERDALKEEMNELRKSTLETIKNGAIQCPTLILWKLNSFFKLTLDLDLRFFYSFVNPIICNAFKNLNF